MTRGIRGIVFRRLLQTPPVDAVALLLIIAVAGFVRLYELDRLPAYINSPDPFNDALSGLDLIRRGIWPRYLEYNLTPQVLLALLDSLSIRLLGPTLLAIRIVTAGAGILTVLGTYLLAVALFRGEGKRTARRVAFLAALGLSLSMIDTHLSRSGYRAVLQPPLQVFFLLFLFRAWRDNRRLNFGASGLLLGMALYTYPSALALLGIPVILTGHQLIFDRKAIRPRAQGLLWMLLGFLLAIFPLIHLSLQTPEILTNRAEQTALARLPEFQEAPLETLLLKSLRQLKAFGLEWSGYYNDMGQPLLPPPYFLLFLTGLAASVVRFRQLEYSVLLLGLPLLLLPDLLTIEAITLSPPSALKIIGTYSWTYLIAGLGGALIWRALETRVSAGRWIAYVGILAAVGWSGGNTYNRYFVVEASHPSRIDSYRITLRDQAIAAYLSEARHPVLVSLEAYRSPEVRYRTAARFPRSRSILDRSGSVLDLDLPENASLLLTASEASSMPSESLYAALLWGETAWVMPAYPAETVTDWISESEPTTIRGLDDEPAAVVFSVRSSDILRGIPEVPRIGAPVQFEGGIRFIGGRTLGFRPGEETVVNLFWDTDRPTSDKYQVFVHLLDDGGTMHAWGDDHPARGIYPTTYWRSDETIPSAHRLQLPADISEGRYWIETGLYRVVDLRRLSVITADDSRKETRVLLGPLKVPLDQDLEPSEISNRLDVRFSGQILLAGFSGIPTEPEPGDTIAITLYWQALTEIPADYSYFVHVTSPDGSIVAQGDGIPRSGRYPTSIWDPGEVVSDTIHLPIPPQALAGTYRLWTGFYLAATGERLSAFGEEGRVSEDRALLLELTFQ